MLTFIADNLANIVLIALLSGVVVWITISLVKKKKSGKSVGCGCSCEGCPSASLCHVQDTSKNTHTAG